MVVQRWSKLLEIIERHGKATRASHLVDVDNDYGPRSWECVDRVFVDEIREPLSTIFEYLACFLRSVSYMDRRTIVWKLTLTPKSNDLRSAFECAEHYRDPAVVRLQKMADSLISAPGQIVVPEGLLIDHAEILPTFWGHIDMAGGRQRRCRNPEDLLFSYPRNQGLGDLFVEHAHIGRCGQGLNIGLKKVRRYDCGENAEAGRRDESKGFLRFAFYGEQDCILALRNTSILTRGRVLGFCLWSTITLVDCKQFYGQTEVEINILPSLSHRTAPFIFCLCLPLSIQLPREAIRREYLQTRRYFMR